MYGNAPFAGAEAESPLSADQRRRLRQDLASVAARTRELLPDDFAVGTELAHGSDGPQATVAVKPPVGSLVSAGYAPDEDTDATIGEDERAELARGLAASAALQMKEAMGDDTSPTAQ